MGHFNNDRQGGGRRGGGNFGGRDQGRPQMHPATCSDCGNRCEVPFKPTGNKPVYCSDCFKRDGDSGSNRGNMSFGKRDSGRGGFGDKRMHQATCADCGNRCEVPFKPTGEKPVYCSDCFGGGSGGDSRPSRPDQGSQQHDEINKKLDKILRILEIISPKKTHIIEKPKEEEKKETPAKEKKKATKKTAKKAPAKKKAAAKKAAKKKPAKKKATKKKK